MKQVYTSFPAAIIVWIRKYSCNLGKLFYFAADKTFFQPDDCRVFIFQKKMMLYLNAREA